MLPRRRASRAAGAVLAGAAAVAAAELVLALALGRFWLWGRAEALLFFAFRPWLLLIAAVLAAGAGWRSRAAFYAAALVLAAGCETLFIVALGADRPWAETLRGLAAGAGLALALDLVVQLGRRLVPRIGAAAGGVAAAALFFWGGALHPYEAVVLGPAPPPHAAERPELLLMSALPLVWGEGGAFDPDSRPEPAFAYLEREFQVRPLDAIDPASLGRARLLLLAQPRALAAEELVALDSWVRNGGRVLILTDPQLTWPSRWPPGDVRRPPASGLLGPLLGHWGVRLEAPAGAALQVELLPHPSGPRRLILDAPGRLVAQGSSCRIAGRDFIFRCRIGRGGATIVADADLLRQDLWAPAGAGGGARRARAADNHLLVADWLDGLAGLRRERLEAPIAWAAPDADRRRALVAAALPIALALALGLGLLYTGRRSPTDLSTGQSP